MRSISSGTLCKECWTIYPNPLLSPLSLSVMRIQRIPHRTRSSQQNLLAMVMQVVIQTRTNPFSQNLRGKLALDGKLLKADLQEEAGSQSLRQIRHSTKKKKISMTFWRKVRFYYSLCAFFSIILRLVGDDLSGSFYLIPSGAEPSPAVLKKENETLKAEISAMKSRLEASERVLKLRKEQDLQLRDSIFMATREVTCRHETLCSNNLLISIFISCLHRPSGHWAHQRCSNVPVLH